MYANDYVEWKRHEYREFELNRHPLRTAPHNKTTASHGPVRWLSIRFF